MATTEFLQNYIQRLMRESLQKNIGDLDYAKVDLTSVCDLYKRQIERMGCTNVSVKASLQDTHDTVDLEVRFTPPPAPIFIEFTVESVKACQYPSWGASKFCGEPEDSPLHNLHGPVFQHSFVKPKEQV